MPHIHQIGTQDESYTVVNDDGIADLTTHPAILDHPELFEIVDADAPEPHQILDYVSDIINN